MDKKIIVVFQQSRVPFFSVRESHILRLRAALPAAEVIWCHSRDEFLAALPNAEVALTWRFQQEWFDLAPELRKIATPAAGRDFFAVTSVPERIEIKNGTFHGPLMAESVLGLLLAFNRGILTAYRHQLQGDLWPDHALLGARLISGTHAVIIGFGKIGQHVGRMLKHFNIRVTGIRRTAVSAADLPMWFESGDSVQPPACLHRVLADADHVIMLLPSDTGTDHFLGEREFECMPAHAVVYNFGRGNSIDETSLAKALRAGSIRGACLDVFQQEPLTAESPLADGNLPGLVRMPHASAFTEMYIERFIDECIEWLR
ncbi:MAG: NAD(P)-dependent oxidoreductase [Kiritimatiellae bacterium]|nr:NAD(P)-dependent oxidoreductase [Kiritimatiellia bacterium]